MLFGGSLCKWSTYAATQDVQLSLTLNIHFQLAVYAML